MSWNPGWNQGWQGGDSNSQSSVTDYGSRYFDPASPQFQKSPGDTIRIPFPWAWKLDGETISTTDFELPDGLTNVGEIGTGTLREVLVSGGSSGQIYRVKSTVVTSGGRVMEWTRRVLVVEG